ncbi:MAG TPA: CHAD domain-containing protein [Candidatus Sulfomarinibacteraceae bacterium]|nr:CHAD domain-containing protein [Candidatus Sulfomarinibacteraceae bacterium]
MPRYLTPPDLDEATVAAVLAPVGTVVLGPPEPLTATYFDTFDWRLHGAGLVLVEELGAERRLCFLDGSREPHLSPATATPTTAGSLPPGYLAERVGPVLGIRALLPVGAARVVRRDGRIEDPNGDLLARLRLEQVTVLDGLGAPVGDTRPTLWTDGDEAAAAVAAAPGVSPVPDNDLEAVTAARGRSPGDYSSKLRIRLDPTQRADRALRAILLELLGTLEANVEGAVADHDTEFVHDLRVACRRSRSALTQVKGVLEADVAGPANAELKWLGGVTNPLRDLDVYLLEMPVYRSMLPPAAAAELAPLETLLRRSRRRAHRSVVRALRSDRFTRFATGWREVLISDQPSPVPEAARPVAEVAGERIARAHRRILKHGRGLGDDPPAEALHRLRIDAKKLRYLLEFFASLYPDDEVGARVKELKRLQDILGGFNDMHVQSEHLAELAGQLRAEPAVGAGCLLALGRLSAALEARQEGFRLAFHDAFADFASKPVRRAFARLAGEREEP